MDDRATVYRKCMTAPDDTTLDAALTQTMETFTRDDAKEMADNGVFEASGKTAQQMKEMIDVMDDETFIRFFRPYMRAILSMQMQQETVKAYSGMTSQEVISAISAKGISSSQYADVYDNYVASSASGSTYNNNLKKLGYVDKDSPAPSTSTPRALRTRIRSPRASTTTTPTPPRTIRSTTPTMSACS